MLTKWRAINMYFLSKVVVYSVTCSLSSFHAHTNIPDDCDGHNSSDRIMGSMTLKYFISPETNVRLDTELLTQDASQYGCVLDHQGSVRKMLNCHRLICSIVPGMKIA